MHLQRINSPQTASRKSGTSREHGVSLIELLIGLTIGLLVAVAAVGSLVYTRVSSTTVGDSSRLQQDASTAFRVIGQHLRQTGARPVQNHINERVRFNPSYSGLSTSTFVILNGTNGTSNANDTLVISYANDTTIDSRDCLGQTPAGATVTNTFTVSANELRCLGSAASATTQAVIPGVEDMQIWYGVRNGTTLSYLTANNVTNWALVETVQVCLRLVGDAAGYPTVDTLGCISGQTVSADGRLRRVFRQVFDLRNVSI